VYNIESLNDIPFPIAQLYKSLSIVILFKHLQSSYKKINLDSVAVQLYWVIGYPGNEILFVID
jgi:hypothetical protein